MVGNINNILTKIRHECSTVTTNNSKTLLYMLNIYDIHVRLVKQNISSIQEYVRGKDNHLACVHLSRITFFVSGLFWVGIQWLSEQNFDAMTTEAIR